MRLFKKREKNLVYVMMVLVIVVVAMVSSVMINAKEAKPRFVYIVKDMTNPYYWRMYDGARKAADELDIDFTWLSARYNGDIEG